MMTKTFPDGALDPVAHHGLRRSLFGNGQTQARIVQSIGCGQHGESPACSASRLGKNTPVLDRPGQSHTAREADRAPFQDVEN